MRINANSIVDNSKSVVVSTYDAQGLSAILEAAKHMQLGMISRTNKTKTNAVTAAANEYYAPAQYVLVN